MPAHTMSAASVATSTSTGLALPQSGARKPVRVLYGTASWPWPWPCPCSVAAAVGMYPGLNTTACGPSLRWRTSSGWLIYRYPVQTAKCKTGRDLQLARAHAPILGLHELDPYS